MWAVARHLVQTMRRCQALPLVLVAVVVSTAVVGAQEARPLPLTAEQGGQFLQALVGPWVGQATTTPRGPRPYDITFARTPTGQVEGAAHPGAATHFWTFYAEDNLLHLRFLSTFAGNTRPLLLRATAVQEGALVFQPSQADFLEVRVVPASTTLTVLIRLRGTPHVAIHLRRGP